MSLTERMCADPRVCVCVLCWLFKYFVIWFLSKLIMKLVNRVFDFWVFSVWLCQCRVRVRASARVLGSYLCSKDLIRDIHWVRSDFRVFAQRFCINYNLFWFWFMFCTMFDTLHRFSMKYNFIIFLKLFKSQLQYFALPAFLLIWSFLFKSSRKLHIHG